MYPESDSLSFLCIHDMEARAFQCEHCFSKFKEDRGLKRHVLYNCSVLKKRVKMDKKKRIHVPDEKATCALIPTCRAEPIIFVKGRVQPKYNRKDVETRLLEVDIQVRQIFEELSRRRNGPGVAPSALDR